MVNNGSLQNSLKKAPKNDYNKRLRGQTNKPMHSRKQHNLKVEIFRANIKLWQRVCKNFMGLY